MSKDRDDERNTGMPGEETFSLEEILAEFGGGPAGGSTPRSAASTGAGGAAGGRGQGVGVPR